MLKIIVISILYGISNLGWKAYGLINPGELFPEMYFELASTENAALRYLNINMGKGNIKSMERINIVDVSADVLILEVLSVYCVSCMAQAPFDRELFFMIEDSAETKGRIKMMGIAVGNNQKEVEKFIGNYNTPYPIFPDPEFSKYDQIGQVRTPFKIFLLRKDNRYLVFKTELGVNRDVKSTFDTAVDMLQGRYIPGEKEGVSVSAKGMIDQGLVTNILEKWLADNGYIKTVKRLFEDSGRTVYKIGSTEGLFAILIDRVSVCDICKDVQFIYIIDSKGKAVEILPVQLSKKNNIQFTKQDTDKIRQALINRNIKDYIKYDSSVDAVTSATITTGIIYDSINKASDIYDLLKEKGFIR